MSGLKYDAPVYNSAEDGFWFVCTAEGRVTLSSSDAARFGIDVGESDAADVIDEDHLLEFEDALHIVKTEETCQFF